jgi:ABC-type glycerol-3-phosphate transport system substrate-binding protein
MRTRTTIQDSYAAPGAAVTRRRLIVGSAGLMAVTSGALLAACGADNQAAGHTGDAKHGAVKFPETLFITTIHNFSTDAGFNAAAEQFSQQHKVKLELVPGNVQEVTTKMAGGTPPDVFRRDAAAFHQQVADGSIRDLNPLLKNEKEIKAADFFPQLIKVQTYQGKLMALPEDFQPASTLYYNKTLLQQSGVQAPTADMTWTQFQETAQKLTKGGDPKDVYGYMYPGWTWEQFVYNFGGQTVDDTSNPTKCLLDQPKAIEGVQFFVDLQHRLKVMPSPEARRQLNNANENTLFQQGKLAMVNHGTWATATWQQAGDALQWGLTLAPKGQDGKWHYATGGAGWAIPKDAKNPEASWEFIKFMFGPQGWKTWLAKRDPKVFWLPAYRPLAEEEAKRLEKIYPNAAQVVKSADYVYLRPGGVRWAKAMTEVLNPILTDLNEGKVQARAALTEATPRINAILANG